jgi:hypothetical protein
MKKIVLPTSLPLTPKAIRQCWLMTPGKPKINAPGQKTVQAQAIRMNGRPGYFSIRNPISFKSNGPQETVVKEDQ